MAATDQHYRDQRRLDIWFAVSSMLMLGSVLWMFVQDYFAAYKPEQRAFRDVDSEVFIRLGLEQITPTFATEHAQATAAVDAARKALAKDGQAKIDAVKAEINKLQPKKEKADAKFQNIKSYLESRSSFYNHAVDQGKTEEAQQYQKEIEQHTKDLAQAAAEKAAVTLEMRQRQNELLVLEKPLNDAIAELNRLNSKLDTFLRTAVKKQWGLGDRIRALPILDAFASPYKVHQFVIDDIPIDYNFKYVTRFDRCMTCHQGIANPEYDRNRLESLRQDISKDLQDRLASVHDVLEKRRKALEGLPDELAKLPRASDLRLNKLDRSWLTDARIAEFAAHPRLDLFVGANSKHPAEKFGCSSCHQGQGSATSFGLAAHTPNDYAQEKKWAQEHHWHHDPKHMNFMWDFPMVPQRYIESSCLKCHHQVTDLIDSNNRNTAPKLLRGFNLIKENGCFGCHEITGRKAGRVVGPDMRLEPYPPRESPLRTPAELTELDANPDNAPGHLRKVGPSLFRIGEKTNSAWAVKWLRSPREFRPDTKMPHFYGVSNNHPDVLPADQKAFPDAEMHAMTFYLFHASQGYLEDVMKAHRYHAIEKNPERDAKDDAFVQDIEKRRQVFELQDKERRKKIKLTAEERQELDTLSNTTAPLDVQALAPSQVHAPLNLDAEPRKGDPERGRFLFTIKGCLACHGHGGVESDAGQKGSETFFPKVISEANFGPDLSQVAAKLGAQGKDKDKSARNWLMQWIMDPHVHSPRSRMPVTHMSDQEAADIAAWLLSPEANKEPRHGEEWNKIQVAKPDFPTLKRLARVYLTRLIPEKNLAELEQGAGLDPLLLNALPEEEQNLVKTKALTSEEKLTLYVGKKGISRQGCYACHDIPGFESAKPIGVNLSDWGKKDSSRLAFENIKGFVDAHYNVEGRDNSQSKKLMAYDRYHYDALVKYQKREGYLNQKILDPRSYDYTRERAWDDRARMPEFRFARSRKRGGEDAKAYEARQVKEEGEAREAVMTFVLGLVAEPVPTKSINQPKGDRLAEVVGRQVLDKYNCAGCHQVRPGVFDFKLDDTVRERLRIALETQKTNSWEYDHLFANHKNWAGKPSVAGNKITVQGVTVNPFYEPEEPALRDEPGDKRLRIILTQALAVPGKDGFESIRAQKPPLALPAASLLYPPPAVYEDPEKFKAFLRDESMQGGGFTELLENFLKDRDASKPEGSKNYRWYEGGRFSQEARSAGPPLLIGQGERTQFNWLYGFLREPYQIRPMTSIPYKADDLPVLRMPKFNMSPEEARALAQYFVSVERLTNPGTDLPPVDEVFAGQGDQSSYWKKRSMDYELRLQKLDSGAVPQPKGGLDKPYATAAFKIPASATCIQCHQVSDVSPTASINRGPALHVVYKRLRPGWTERWLALPERMIYYTPMPENLRADKHSFANFAPIMKYDKEAKKWIVDQRQTAFAQIQAARDALSLYPELSALPPNHNWLEELKKLKK